MRDEGEKKSWDKMPRWIEILQKRRMKLWRGDEEGRAEVCNYKEEREEMNRRRCSWIMQRGEPANTHTHTHKHTHTHTLRRRGVFQAEVARRDTERKRSRFSSNICGLWKWLVFKKRNNFWWKNANVTSWCCIWIISPGYKKNNTSDRFSQPFWLFAYTPTYLRSLCLFLWVAYFQPSLCRLKKKKKPVSWQWRRVDAENESKKQDWKVENKL